MKSLILFLILTVSLIDNLLAQTNCSGVIVDTPVIISSGIRCGPGSIALEVNTSIGTRASWYKDSVGGLPVRSNSIYYTANITSDSVIYVEAKEITNGCYSKRIKVKMSIDCGVGLTHKPINKTEISVFPNPSYGQFTIVINDFQKANLINYQIYDLLGKFKLSGFLNLSKEIDVNLTNYKLEAGNYLFNYQIGEVKGTNMIILK